jgi:pyruvate/2-oxoacid:ferredoxin oxidoreductase alpha subunit
MDKSTRTMVIEGNLTGQLEGLVRQECLRSFDWHINRYDGRPFSPERIYKTVKGVMCGVRDQ